jgi:hypothetical protein
VVPLFAMLSVALKPKSLAGLVAATPWHGSVWSSDGDSTRLVFRLGRRGSHVALPPTLIPSWGLPLLPVPTSYSQMVLLLADDMIRLRYVCIDSQLRKTILKMRRGNHSKDIREYEIASNCRSVFEASPLYGHELTFASTWSVLQSGYVNSEESGYCKPRLWRLSLLDLRPHSSKRQNAASLG